MLAAVQNNWHSSGASSSKKLGSSKGGGKVIGIAHQMPALLQLTYGFQKKIKAITIHSSNT